jgi:uncharacterized protein (TIGR03085 family)
MREPSRRAVRDPACDDRAMPSLAAIERVNLVEALRAAGPQAPTLCAGWTTHDLAAHLVARERRPDSGPGILVPALSGWTEQVRRRYARRPFEELLRLIETGPPWTSPFALPGVDATVNLTEHFVHCEDVRRAAPDWRPRELPEGLADALWKALATRGRMLFRRAPSGITLATPDGRRAEVTSGERALTLTGEPAELTLYAFGRREHARVTPDGAPEALDRLRAANFGI